MRFHASIDFPNLAARYQGSPELPAFAVPALALAAGAAAAAGSGLGLFMFLREPPSNQLVELEGSTVSIMEWGFLEIYLTQNNSVPMVVKSH